LQPELQGTYSAGPLRERGREREGGSMEERWTGIAGGRGVKV